MPTERDFPASVIRVHLVGNAHIDPAWLWSYAEGRTEVLATYRAAVEFLHEEPALLFTAGGSVTYTWVEQDDPDLLGEIRKLVEEGRWCLVNGWWVEPDCNLPSAESFARHALYGQRTLQRLFGRRATVGYNVDSFGHNAALPGLLLGGGLSSYLFSRPDPTEKDLPAEYFWWEGMDGSRVLAGRLTAHYQGTPQELPERIRRSAAGASAEVGQVLCFFGVGNHGGGPTRQDLAVIQELRAAQRQLELEFSSPDRFFDAIRPAAESFPVYRGELQHHSRGCYSVVAEMKRLNRRAEAILTTAETATAWASRAAGLSYPDLSAAWQTVLQHQFHDTLGGTCLPEVYEEEVFPALQGVIRSATRATQDALEVLGTRVAMEKPEDGSLLLIFNPLSFRRNEAIQATIPASDWRDDFPGNFRPARVVVEDSDGAILPSQVVGMEHVGGTYRVHFTFVADVPPLGYRVVRVRIPADAGTYAEEERPLDRPLENQWLRVAFDPQTGSMSSLFLRQQGSELGAGPLAVPLVVDDPSDTWSHGVRAFEEVIGQFEARGDVALVENGPVRSVVRTRSRWGSSTVTAYWALYQELARLEGQVDVEWHEQHRMLKLAFPVNVAGGQVSAEIPGGIQQRAADGTEQPCLGWVDVSGPTPAGPRAGLSLLNDRLYGYSAVGNEVRLTLLRSPIYAFHQPRQPFPGVKYQYTDQGAHRFRLALAPHPGSPTSAWTSQPALALNHPCDVVPLPLYPTDSQPAGRPSAKVEPPLASWGEIRPGSVVAEAIKVAEDGSGDLILRARETEGQGCHVALRLDDRQWEADFHPFQVRTWRLARSPAAERLVETNLLEEPLRAPKTNPQ
jgi:alpha-mannosidase